ncbi:hypothetical protein DsansV1_C05g0056371 [Dioscorea sansibarensis]
MTKVEFKAKESKCHHPGDEPDNEEYQDFSFVFRIKSVSKRNKTPTKTTWRSTSAAFKPQDDLLPSNKNNTKSEKIKHYKLREKSSDFGERLQHRDHRDRANGGNSDRRASPRLRAGSSLTVDGRGSLIRVLELWKGIWWEMEQFIALPINALNRRINVSSETSGSAVC